VKLDGKTRQNLEFSLSPSGLRFMDVILRNFMRVQNGYAGLHLP